jgi:hypothetical protein
VEIKQGASKPVRLNLSRGSTLDLETALGEEGTGDLGFGEEMLEAKPVTDAAGITSVAIAAGTVGRLPISLLPRSPVEVGMKLQVPATSKAGDVIDVDVVQKDSRGNVIGGVAMQVRVTNKK